MHKVVVFIVAGMIFFSVNPVMAGEGQSFLSPLLKDGITTDAGYTTVLEEPKTDAGQNEKADTTGVITDKTNEDRWTDRITFSGSIETELRWQEKTDVRVRNSDSDSDLYVGTVEFGVQTNFAGWINGFVLFLAEDLGTDDEADMTISEATLTIQKEGIPFYLIFGKRTQPFGLFENTLVTDPMTQDAHETIKAGLTAGITGPFGTDASITIYKGEEQMNHLADSGLFEITRAGKASNDLSSYIVSLSAKLIEYHLTLFCGFLSEPGRGKRNDTLNLGFNLAPPYLEGLRLVAEYIKAQKREYYDGKTEEFKEAVLSVSGTYAITEHLELSARSEHFDDDNIAEKTSTWSVENRYSGGMKYSFYNDEESGLSAYAAAEYRHTDYRLHESLKNEGASNNREIYIKLGMSF